MIAVSECLAGHPCRYDGGAKPDAAVQQLLRAGEAVCICPECMGGLPTPRLPSEIVGGDGADVWTGAARVMNTAGEDVSRFFMDGARRALACIQQQGIDTAILKARSPSCGAGEIYDGTFSGRLKHGDGVTTALLRAHGISIQTR